MKLNTTLRKTAVAAALTFGAFSTMTFSSCTKKEDRKDGAKFVGTWNGSYSCSGSASSGSQIIISAGSDDNTVTMQGYVGSGSCQKNITYNLAANGTALVCNQNFTDNCGNSYSVSIAGTLANNTLSLSFSGAGGGTGGTCVFTGTK